MEMLKEGARTSLLGITLICYLLMMPCLSGILTNAIYGLATGDWSYFIEGSRDVTIGYVFFAAKIAYELKITFTAALVKVACLLGPVGWGILLGALILL